MRSARSRYKKLKLLLTPKIDTLNSYINVLEFIDPFFETSEFSKLILSLQSAIKLISLRIRRRKLGKILSSIYFLPFEISGLPGIIEDIFIREMKKCDCVGNIICHGREDIINVDPKGRGKYIICFKGLCSTVDNIESNIPVGTIFSIYRKALSKISSDEDLYSPIMLNLRTEYLLAAGYALYGVSTNFVLGIKKYDVNKYVLDPVIGEFIVVERKVKLSDSGIVICVDEGNSFTWEHQILDYLKSKRSPEVGQPRRIRVTGDLAGDFHRILVNGGIFLYPNSRNNAEANLTLITECIPLAFIAHLSGGLATTGKTNVLNIKPQKLNEKIPFFIGSFDEVYELQKNMAKT